MYEIKVLSSEEFEQLPYGRVKEALGVADPKTNTAYVRHTAYPELNKYLINHEFEHLIEEHPTDEIDGVRYKIPLGPIMQLGNFLAPLINKIVPGNDGLFGTAGKFFGGLFSPFIRAATVGPTQTFNEMLGRGQQSQVFTSQQQQQFQQPSGGSYVPQSSIFLSNGGYGSPLSLFSGSGSYTPSQVPGAASGLSDPGSGALGGNVETPEWMKQQKYGSENGRIMFK